MVWPETTNPWEPWGTKSRSGNGNSLGVMIQIVFFISKIQQKFEKWEMLPPIEARCWQACQLVLGPYLSQDLAQVVLLRRYGFQFWSMLSSLASFIGFCLYRLVDLLNCCTVLPHWCFLKLWHVLYKLSWKGEAAHRRVMNWNNLSLLQTWSPKMLKCLRKASLEMKSQMFFHYYKYFKLIVNKPLLKDKKTNTREWVWLDS